MRIAIHPKQELRIVEKQRRKAAVHRHATSTEKPSPLPPLRQCTDRRFHIDLNKINGWNIPQADEESFLLIPEEWSALMNHDPGRKSSPTFEEELTNVLPNPDSIVL